MIRTLKNRTERLRDRLARLLDHSGQPQPIRQQRQLAPSVHPLEPRFVLNATPDLMMLAQAVAAPSVTSATADVTVISEGVTLISRNGDNLEIRTGDQLSTAQAATPVLAPITGSADQRLSILGTAADDLLILDVDQFIDSNPMGVNFGGQLTFGGSSGEDQLALLDSNPATIDVFESTRYQLGSSTGEQNGSIAVTSAASTDFRMLFFDVESIQQSLETQRLEIRTTFRSDRLVIDNAPLPGHNLIQTSTDGSAGSVLTVSNPTEFFSVHGFQNNDEFVINGIDSEFKAAIEIDGESGIDSIVIDGSLQLGAGSVTGDVDLRAESIQIPGSIDTTGGDVDGQVAFSGGALVNVSGHINTGNSDVIILAGSRLEGDGRIESNVIVQDDGQIAAGTTGGNQTASLNVGSIELQEQSVLEVQLNGPTAGSDYDQIVINANDAVDGAAMIDGALLDFALGFSPGQNTEFVLIDNDGTDEINGRFRTLIGVDGSLLSVARTLNEGDLVFDSTIGAAEAAYITYFGGDGNDVAIVMGGDVTIQSQGVTLISRNGANLEIRVGATLAAAQMASPTVRPIAGLNGNELSIHGIAAGDDELYVDVNRFVDAQGINFDGTIVFTGNEGMGDQDRLVVFDSDPSTDDGADAVTYTSFGVPESGVLAINPAGGSTQIAFEHSDTEFVDQLVAARQIDVLMSNRDESLVIDQTPGMPNLNQLQLGIAATPGTLINTISPLEQFSIQGGTGKNVVTFNGIATDFSAQLEVNGQAGLDSLTIATPLSLGDGGVTGNVQLSAEAIQIGASISTTGGISDGSVTINGVNRIFIDQATVDTGGSPILIDGNGGSVDTAGGTLRSTDSVTIRDASSLLLGSVDTPGGTLTLGIARDITGPINQAENTNVVVDRLTVSSNSAVDLSQSSNQIGVLDGIESNGAISISDSSGDLQLIDIDSGGNDISLSTAGTAVLQTPIQSPGSTVRIDAGEAIRDFDPTDTTAKITADKTILSAGSGGIGVGGALEVNTDVLSIDTSPGNGNVNVTNPFGNLRIDQVDAGSGSVQLSANQIDDATDDTLSDFTASRLELTAMTGIGSVRPLELTSVQQLNAQTDSGGIQLDWMTSGDTVVEQLIAGSGGILLTQRGGATLNIEVLENQSGAINILSEDGSIDIAAGPEISAETIRIEAFGDLSIDRSMRATAGPLNLLSNETLTLTGEFDTTAAAGNGVISITSSAIHFHDVNLISAGGDIIFGGILTIDGESRIDSGNQQAAPRGGDVMFTQSIRGADSIGDRLLIDARGINADGNVTSAGTIGATGGSIGATDLNALAIFANVINVHSAGVTGGDIRLTGSQVTLTGNELRTSISGDLEIDAPLTVPAGDTVISAAGSALLHGDIAGAGSPANLMVTAGAELIVHGDMAGLAGLFLDAQATTRLIGSVAVTGDMTLDGQAIEVFAPLITTPGMIVFADEVIFKADSLVTANQVRFDGAVIIDRLATAEIDGSIVNSPATSELSKAGEGTLVLSGNSPFTQGTRITAGILRVTGTFGSSAADLIVESMARLEGDGRIGANVVIGNQGTLGPGSSEPTGDEAAALFTDSLELLPGSRLEVEINGPIAGQDSDLIVVDPPGDGIVNVGGATLDASVSFLPLESTEFVIIDNDGIDDVIGRFDSAAEGRIILGSEGVPGPRAYITYFGGDGNDVSIVTAGDLSIDSAGVTVVSRRGTNLEIRTAESFANAQAANPVIRPIGALNGQELRIVGQQADDVLFVDVDQFVDPDPQGINYNGTIAFSGQERAGDQDKLVIFDSDPVTNDTIEAITYAFTSLDDGLITVDPRFTDQSFAVQFSDLEFIDQPIDSARLGIITSDLSEQINIAESAGLIPIQVTSAGVSGTQLSIPTPQVSFSLNAGGGDDNLQVNNLTDVRSEIVIEGGGGTDALTLATTLNLGQDEITGNVELSAETLRIQNSIDTSGGDVDGNVRLTSGTLVTFEPGAAIFSGAGNITIDGNGGIIDASGGFVRSLANDDAVVIRDANAVTLSGIQTPNGATVIGVDQDITGPVSQAPGVRLITDRLAASTAGPIDLSNTFNEIRVVDDFSASGPVSLTDAAADLTLLAVNSDNQDVTINAAGTVLVGNAGLDVGAAIVTINATDAIEDLSPADGLINISGGTLFLNVAAGGIGSSSAVNVVASQSINADTSALSGDIRLATPTGTMRIGIVNAGDGSVRLSGDRIEDAANDSIADIIAARLELVAQNGIDVTGAVELQGVRELSAISAAGGIHLDWTATAPTVLEQLTTSSGDILLTQRGGQTIEIQSVRTLGDDITITNEDATIDIVGRDGVADAIATDGGGVISLSALGHDSDLILKRGIRSGSGDVNISADANVILHAAGDVNSLDGVVRIRADERDGQLGGQITMFDGAIVAAGIGTVDIASDGDIALGSLRTSNQSVNAVLVQSHSGAITDGGEEDLDIVANTGSAMLRSHRGIGSDDRLETAIAILDGRVTGSGSIELLESDEIRLQSVITHDGLIEITAGDTITAIHVVSENVNGLDDGAPGQDDQQRDITLAAQGSRSDIRLGQISAFNGADVFLLASDDVSDLDTLDDQRVVADDLQVISGNDTEDHATAVLLTTAINDLNVTVAGAHRGDVEIHELDSLRLASSDRAADDERIETTNGEIRILAAESIRIFDPNPGNESFDRTADPEIIAGGENGRIRMEATRVIEVANAVQLNADQSTIEAVVLASTDIVFGEQIEINTGQGVGVARVLSPRPRIDLVDTAFFEFTTVKTNRLEQASINDAEGILTIDVGSQGERGLTINIDWGAESGRFQQIDGLSGDAPPLSVKHLYLENEILDTRLNDRPSATAPLNVKFSVRHHDSILLLGSTVAQAGGPVNMVAGGVVSTTDNPLTFENEQIPILENGTASFIIPTLSIPVAFFPVRDVIPVSDVPEVIVFAEQTVTVTQSTFETVAASASSSAIREEYFQIRAISPDPFGGDLALPERLPDDILNEDKLSDLFSNLPDGRYEIEYVLGDGNERSILQVDLRAGEPIIRSDDLDGGMLKLKLLEGDPSELEAKERDDAAVPPKPQAPSPDDAAINVSPTVKMVADGAQETSSVAALGVGLIATRRLASRNRRRRETNRFSAAQRMLGRAGRLSRPQPDDNSPNSQSR